MKTNEHTLAWQRLTHLVALLKDIVKQDPEQEVSGMAVPVLDAVLAHAKTVIGADPVVEAASDVVSVVTIEQGLPIRAVDALLVAEQLLVALGQPAWPE